MNSHRAEAANEVLLRIAPARRDQLRAFTWFVVPTLWLVGAAVVYVGLPSYLRWLCAVSGPLFATMLARAQLRQRLTSTEFLFLGDGRVQVMGSRSRLLAQLPATDPSFRLRRDIPRQRYWFAWSGFVPRQKQPGVHGSASGAAGPVGKEDYARLRELGVRLDEAHPPDEYFASATSAWVGACIALAVGLALPGLATCHRRHSLAPDAGRQGALP